MAEAAVKARMAKTWENCMLELCGWDVCLM
jgi:hypothetical protein